MKPDKTFQDKSYRQHSEHFKDYTRDQDKAAHARTWLESDTVDAWRHRRMYRVIDPLLATEPQATWLTVGDGRYGKDAQYLANQGADALATDISEYLLREASELGHLAKYRVENAEALSFQDSSFDYVLCKESYHHFPRPMLALYEMLRVAKSGVLLIEPNDHHIAERVPQVLSRNLGSIVKSALGKKVVKHWFEEWGNYVFTVSRRELEKVALGLNLRTVAFKGINDVYLPGVEHEKLSADGPLRKKIDRRIAIRNLLCELGVLEYNLLAAIIFKKEPSEQQLRRLEAEGYEVVRLPDNPYISG